jgi:hypothetical protein
MEAISFSEMLVGIHRTTQLYIPEKIILWKTLQTNAFMMSKYYGM